MSIIQGEINVYQFRDAFREIRPDNFSYAGLGALFEYLDDLSDDIGEPITLDVIALCCEYAEYELTELLHDYDDYHDDIRQIKADYESGELDDSEAMHEVCEYLSEHTQVIRIDDNNLIIAGF